MTTTATMTIDGRSVAVGDERNVLEVCRREGIDIPTFCYHSHLSIYGACRLCLVDIEGRGVVTSCTTVPEPGLVIRTHTDQIRRMRRIAVELLLANHDQRCPTCGKSGACRLQDLARRLGIREPRFASTLERRPVDASSHAVTRDPNRCVLCGDCVRACREVQGVGAIDFAHRGTDSTVVPAWGEDLAGSGCVDCGACVAVCPTGALVPTSSVDAVWHDLHDPAVVVVAQIAPAVRVAIAEEFGQERGTMATGQVVAALRRLGFDQVMDTGFAADLTVMEETEEFIGRVSAGERLPQFTSCCPAWVNYAEQYRPDILPLLSTCRSPQQMLGALAKRILPQQLKLEGRRLVMVSIMPCTAKKGEARRPAFVHDGQPEVDHVLTTRELAAMIAEQGLDWRRLEPESLDMPFGFKTGAGLLFGHGGGVTEAVVRLAGERLAGQAMTPLDPQPDPRWPGLRRAELDLGDRRLRLAMVQGLASAGALADAVLAGEVEYDLIEVMACPGGCVGGAGQPVTIDPQAVARRTKALREADRTLQLHRSQDNHLVAALYAEHLGAVGSPRAHACLHTCHGAAGH